MDIINEKAVKISIIRPSDGTRFSIDPTSLPLREIKKRIDDAKSNGYEIRWYYLPRTSFEIIKTAVPPGHQQPYHSHHKIQEATLVLDGQIVVVEEIEGKKRTVRLMPDDFIVFDSGEKAYHTIKNSTSSYSLTLTFKFIGPITKDPNLFSKDWHGR